MLRISKNLRIYPKRLEIRSKRKMIESGYPNSSQKRVLDPDTSVRDIWPVIQPKMHPLQVHLDPCKRQTVRDFAAISASRELERFLILGCQSRVISQLRQTDVLHASEDVSCLGISLIHEHAGTRLRNYPLSFSVKSHVTQL